MKIWILGAMGLLGSALTRVVRSAAIDCLATSHHDVDIGDEPSLQMFVQTHPGITHIVNCAAFSLVDLAETDQQRAWSTNALGPELLGKIALATSAKLIHISTDYVFSGSLWRPLREEDPTEPLNYYGKTKREGEIRLLRVNPDACILRTSSIFGSGGKNFVTKLWDLLAQEREIRLSNDQWVRPTSAMDLSWVILKILHSFQSGIYHYANAGVATKFKFGCEMREILEREKYPVAVQSLKGVLSSTFSSCCKRPVYCVFDTTKIETTFQIKIRSWEDALQEFIMQKKS